MRESVGATWLTQIVITFILLFAAIICYAVNYGKAFKVKNQIVEDIESAGSPGLAKSKINKYLNNVGYKRVIKYDSVKKDLYDNYGNNCVAYVYKDFESGGKDGYFHVCKIQANDSSCTGDICKVYYKVYVGWGFDLPVLGNLLDFKMTGTTKVMDAVDPNNSGDSWYK